MGIFSDDPNFIPSNLLSGKSYFGMAGTMPNMVTANPNGIGAGRSNAINTGQVVVLVSISSHSPVIMME